MADIKLNAEELALIEALEEELGRPLTTIERLRAEAVIISHVANTSDESTLKSLLGRSPELGSEGIWAPDPKLAPLPTVGALRMGIAGGLTAGVDEITGDNTTPTVTPTGFNVATAQVSEAAMAGLPAQFTPTGETDIFGRAVVGEQGDNFLVWDPQFQQVLEVPPIFISGSKEEEDPNAPTEYLGGIPIDVQLPTNLGEVAEKREAALDQFVSDSAAEDAFTGANMGAPGGPNFKGIEIKYGDPQYLPGDQWTDFATKDPGYIRAVQQSMVDAGLMSESQFNIGAGTWTAESASAMQQAMIEANYTGGAKTWVQILADRKAAFDELGEGGSGTPGPLAGRHLVIPAYKEPDPAAITQDVKGAMAKQLARDPLDYELALLGDYLTTQYRAQYDDQVENLKAEFEAGNRAILAGAASTATVSDTGEVVDPAARLMEMIESRYAPEIELNQDRVSTRQDATNVFNVLTATTQALGAE